MCVSSSLCLQECLPSLYPQDSSIGFLTLDCQLCLPSSLHPEGSALQSYSPPMDPAELHGALMCHLTALPKLPSPLTYLLIWFSVIFFVTLACQKALLAIEQLNLFLESIMPPHRPFTDVLWVSSTNKWPLGQVHPKFYIWFVPLTNPISVCFWISTQQSSMDHWYWKKEVHDPQTWAVQWQKAVSDHRWHPLLLLHSRQ